MKRALAALILAGATALTGACGDDAPNGSGDSNPPNQQTQEPAETPNT